MSEIKLKPCPFCGSEEIEIIGVGRDWEYTVKCNSCNAGTDYFINKKEAKEAWNRRAYEEK